MPSSVPRWLTSRYADRLRPRLRRVHPVRWLRWLRAGTLAMILLTAALSAIVAYQAHEEVTAAVNGARAVYYIDQAAAALGKANQAVNLSYGHDYVRLAGQGTDFQNQLTAATQELLLAAESNAAGPQAAAKIQFAEGLLVVYTGQIQQVGIAEGAGNQILARAELGYAGNLAGSESPRCSSPWYGAVAAPGIQASLGELACGEIAAVRAAEDSAWLRPGVVWPVVLAPFLVMLLLAAGTAAVLWAGFRRLLSVRLTIALAATASLAALLASLDIRDSGQLTWYFRLLLSGQPPRALPSPGVVNASYAFCWWTLAAGLLLTTAAMILAHYSYQPRIGEYRYPR